jgi:hypothetical protein
VLGSTMYSALEHPELGILFGHPRGADRGRRRHWRRDVSDRERARRRAPGASWRGRERAGVGEVVTSSPRATRGSGRSLAPGARAEPSQIRPIPRVAAMFAVADARVGASGEEQTHDVDVPLSGGEMQRRHLRVPVTGEAVLRREVELRVGSTGRLDPPSSAPRDALGLLSEPVKVGGVRQGRRPRSPLCHLAPPFLSKGRALSCRPSSAAGARNRSRCQKCRGGLNPLCDRRPPPRHVGRC